MVESCREALIEGPSYTYFSSQPTPLYENIVPKTQILLSGKTRLVIDPTAWVAIITLECSCGNFLE